MIINVFAPSSSKLACLQESFCSGFSSSSEREEEAFVPRGHEENRNSPLSSYGESRTTHNLVLRPSSNLVFHELFAQTFTQYANIPSQSGSGAIDDVGHLVVNPALPLGQRATRAVSALLYGTLRGDETIRLEAFKFYISTIKRVSLELHDLEKFNNSEAIQPTRILIPKEELIYSTLMMVFFECVWASSPVSWLHHLFGAEKLLIMRGPQQCQSGLSHRLFRTIRYSLVKETILTTLSLIV